METMKQNQNPFQSPPILEEENPLQITTYPGNLTQMDELATTNEEIRRARETLMQSWLDSKPLIDQLEKLQLDHKRAKVRASMATAVIPDLETQLETTQTTIKSTREQEAEARTNSDKLSTLLDKIREEMETLKIESDQERRARLKLKQELRLRRQTLRALQLTIRAVRIDSEAVEASTGNILHRMNQSDEEILVQLPQEEYYGLTRRAQEEKELAEWRVSVSMEQRDMAEASRDEALRRLKGIYTGNRSRKEEITEVTEEEEEEEEALTIPAISRERSRNNSNKKMNKKKKKKSILDQIKSFLVRSITRIFG